MTDIAYTTPEEIRYLGVGSEWTWVHDYYYSDESESVPTAYVIFGFEETRVQFGAKGENRYSEAYSFRDFGRWLKPSTPELRALTRFKHLLTKATFQGLESEVQELLVKLEV